MSLAANILVYLACTGGGVAVGYGLSAFTRRETPREARKGMRQGAGWQKPVAPPDPADRPIGPPPKPTPGHQGIGRPDLNGAGSPAYAIAQVRDLYCIDPRCRLDHPDPDVVLIGRGLSGSAYQCRHCLTTW